MGSIIGQNGLKAAIEKKISRITWIKAPMKTAFAGPLVWSFFMIIDTMKNIYNRIIKVNMLWLKVLYKISRESLMLIAGNREAQKETKRSKLGIKTPIITYLVYLLFDLKG